MEWMVELSGDPSDLDELSKVFTTPELSIKKEGDKFLLRTTNFESCASSVEIKKIASEIVHDLTAGIKLSLDARKKLDIDGIVQIGDDGLRHHFIDLSGTAVARCSASGRLNLSDGTREVFHQADPIPRWIKIAHKDAKVAKAFDFICADFNSWGTLYKILEVLEEDHFKPIMRRGRYKEMANDFTNAANSYTMTGLDARHATERTPTPPKNPMSLSEARSFIKMLLHEWLKEKEKIIP